jgi:cation:H+ antiporter
VASFGIVVIWISGMMILNRVRNRPELAFEVAGGSSTGEHSLDKAKEEAGQKANTRRVILVFILASVVTLVAGVVLEQTGNMLADNWGINGVLFGATILSLATALPEISSGITGVRMGRYTLVYGDMFGGNAFQLTLFLIADIVAGQPVLPYEGISNVNQKIRSLRIRIPKCPLNGNGNVHRPPLAII